MSIAKTNFIAEPFQSGLVMPASLVSKWQTAKTDLSSAYTPAVITPAATWSAPGSGTVLHRVQGEGTSLIVRCRYSGSATAVGTSPVYRVLGRRRPTSDVVTDNDVATTAYEWEFLKNRNGDLNCTCTCNPGAGGTYDILLGDASVGMFASTVDMLLNWHDCQGCNDFVIVLITAMSQTGGANTTSLLECKIV